MALKARAGTAVGKSQHVRPDWYVVVIGQDGIGAGPDVLVTVAVGELVDERR